MLQGQCGVGHVRAVAPDTRSARTSEDIGFHSAMTRRTVGIGPVGTNALDRKLSGNSVENRESVDRLDTAQPTPDEDAEPDHPETEQQHQRETDDGVDDVGADPPADDQTGQRHHDDADRRMQQARQRRPPAPTTAGWAATGTGR